MVFRFIYTSCTFVFPLPKDFFYLQPFAFNSYLFVNKLSLNYVYPSFLLRSMFLFLLKKYVNILCLNLKFTFIC